MNYVGEVADLFRSRSGATKILCPMDYVIIAEGEKQEVPLEVVTASITEVCDRPGGKEIKIDSVGYFQDVVKQNFRVWLQSEASLSISAGADGRKLS